MESKFQNKKFCMIGHVDAGKSTTAGHLYALCGGLSEHELKKLNEYEKKTQKWSNILDIHQEEKEKGKTHEFNTLEWKYNDDTYVLIDTPGHKQYIRSMISGISYFDPLEIVACLIISAGIGEFEAGWNGGQTREDIVLVRSTGIRYIIVIINKMDQSNWDKERYDDICNKVSSYIKKCNFAAVEYIPISGYSGTGLINLKEMPEWYMGLSLIDSINKMSTIANNYVTSEEYQKLDKIQLPHKWKTMIAAVQILKLTSPSIISSGYTCVAHYDGNEYNVTIEQMEKKFIKEGDKCKIKLVSETPFIKYHESTNILLRNGTETIGFGKILKVKHE